MTPALASRSRDEWITQTERRLHRERRARQVTATRYWTILEHPQEPHEKLEWRTRRTWSLATYGRDFPLGWRARWATLINAQLGACAPPPHKVILIAEGHPRIRTERDLQRTLVHECAHLGTLLSNTYDPHAPHGSEFVRTLREFEWAVFGERAEEAPWSRYTRRCTNTVLGQLGPTAAGDRIGLCAACGRWRTVPAETAAPVCPVCPTAINEAPTQRREMVPCPT